MVCNNNEQRGPELESARVPGGDPNGVPGGVPNDVPGGDPGGVLGGVPGGVPGGPLLNRHSIKVPPKGQDSRRLIA